MFATALEARAQIELGRTLHAKYHGTPPPAVLLTEFCVCGTNSQTERRRAIREFVESNFYSLRILASIQDSKVTTPTSRKPRSPPRVWKQLVTAALGNRS